MFELWNQTRNIASFKIDFKIHWSTVMKLLLLDQHTREKERRPNNAQRTNREIF